MYSQKYDISIYIYCMLFLNTNNDIDKNQIISIDLQQIFKIIQQILLLKFI